MRTPPGVVLPRRTGDLFIPDTGRRWAYSLMSALQGVSAVAAVVSLGWPLSAYVLIVFVPLLSAQTTPRYDVAIVTWALRHGATPQTVPFVRWGRRKVAILAGATLIMSGAIILARIVNAAEFTESRAQQIIWIVGVITSAAVTALACVRIGVLTECIRTCSVPMQQPNHMGNLDNTSRCA